MRSRYQHRGGPRFRRGRYRRQKIAISKANFKGIYNSAQLDPDVLYTTARCHMNSGTGCIDGAIEPGNIFVNSGTTVQSIISAGAPNVITLNHVYPKFQKAGTSYATGSKITGGYVGLDRWATFYNYLSIYEVDIKIDIGSVFTLDTTYDYTFNEEGYYFYWCMPNQQFPNTTPQNNPWGFPNTVDPDSLMRTPKIHRMKLNNMNTASKDFKTVRLKWKLKDCAPGQPDYMVKNTSVTTGSAWGDVPYDSTNASSLTYWTLYFWMGTDTGVSPINAQARWKCTMIAKAKLWQPRPGVLKPVLGFDPNPFRNDWLPHGKTRDHLLRLVETQEEQKEQDQVMDEPMTPLLEQLTKELKMYKNH